MKKTILITVALNFFIAANSISQNVGIGTTTPIYKLDVRGSINSDSIYRIAGNPVLSIKGSENTFIAVGSETAITTGYSNTGIGYLSLLSNTTGFLNTAIGIRTLKSNIIGTWNTAVGYQALMNNTTGVSNSAMGYLALLSNTTGRGNVACGVASLEENLTGDYNTACGYNALNLNSSGLYNTAVGFRANLSASGTLSHYNTAVGANALLLTNNSQYNTAVGYNAGDTYNNGYNNVFMGANTDVNGAGLFNVIAMGQGTIVTSGSSTARFGNSATVSYGGWAGWSNISDGRFKKNIKENVPGLEFINKLRPITYQLAATELDAFLHKDVPDKMSAEGMQVHTKALSEKENIIYSGFIAQEVETIAKQLGFDFSGVDAPRNADDTYGLRYAEFVVPLVKAVQEQQQMIETLKQTVSLLKKQNEELLKRIEKLESSPISK